MKVGSVLIYLGILLAMLLNACNASTSRAENNFAGKDYEVEYFNQIKLTGGYNVSIVQADEPSLVVKASESDHNKIDVWVENNRLYVKNRYKNITTDEIKLEISVKDLNDIWVEGGVYLSTLGYIDVDRLEMVFQGGANVDMQAKAKYIKIKAEGGVNIEIEGVTDELVAISEGAGNIDADRLTAKNVDCRVSGVGNASVYATNELNATIEGVGRIGYRGNPVVNKKVSGIGVVHQR